MTTRSEHAVRVAIALIALTCTVAMPFMARAGGSSPLSPANAGRDHEGSPPIAETAPWTSKVTSLLRAMTWQEKLAIVHGSPDPDPRGQAGHVSGIPRLGIPEMRHVDALGINVYRDATGLPTRLGMASSFDRRLFRRLGGLEGREGRALSMDVFYGPQVDLARFPFWGRNFSTFGEDPYLSSQLVQEEISGIQAEGLMSEVKHFTFYNGQPQNTPSVIDDQVAHELYLQPSEAALRGGRVSAYMCSYAIFQVTPVESAPVYACENAWTLNTILRGQWDFRGFVGTDYGATKNAAEILKGTDQEMGTAVYFLAAPPASAPTRIVLGSLVDPSAPTHDPQYAAALDTAAARVLYQAERFGLLDCAASTGAISGCVLPARPRLDKVAGIRAAEGLAEASAVLLKNQGDLLPLDRSLRSLAVIGPTADLMPTSPGGERSRGFGDRAQSSPLDVLRDLGGPRARIAYAPGIDRLGTVVPAMALHTPDGVSVGLLRTGSDGSSTIDVVLDGSLGAGLAKGVSYTWSGTVDIPTSDTYALWLRRSVGVLNAVNGALNPTGSQGAVTLTVDGAPVTLGSPSSLIPNNYPGGQTVNGQYLGLTNSGAKVALTAGRHTIAITFNVSAAAATTPTISFSWSPLQPVLEQAIAAARAARVALVFVDDASLAAGGAGSSSGGVAPSDPGGVASLTPGADALIAAVAAVNPNTIVVLNTAQPVLMPWLDSVPAVLEMWYPGQEGGAATARLLTGLANPSGKLPMTFPASSSSTPLANSPERTTGVNGVITWSEGLQTGYRWYDANGVPPLFPFGHGLSYTTFVYSALRIDRSRDGGFDVGLRIRNTGHVPGATVAEVYVGPSRAAPVGVQQVVRKLVQFERVELDPGHAADVTLHVAPHELSYWSTGAQAWILGTGPRGVFVGSSSRDLPLHGTVIVR